jgi:hypothetical protein
LLGHCTVTIALTDPRADINPSTCELHTCTGRYISPYSSDLAQRLDSAETMVVGKCSISGANGDYHIKT